MNSSTCRLLAIVFGLLLGLGALASDAPPATATAPALPTLFITGDSTVNNSGRGMQGWGTPVAELFDRTKINVQNKARGGRSSRTYLTEGLWDQVAKQLKPGDFLLIQFGHNDGGALSDPRARASIKGTGDETKEAPNAQGAMETLHTYGWYLHKYVSDAKAKGAMPIICSPVPRNLWKDGHVARADQDYGKWAGEVARADGVPFIDLNDLIARKYERAGREKVTAEYFTEVDHTHTSVAGAKLAAETVVEGIRGLEGCRLKEYLLPEARK